MGSEWTVFESCKKNMKTCNLVYMGIIWLQEWTIFESCKRNMKICNLVIMGSYGFKSGQ